MVLVAIAPAINGMQFKRDKENGMIGSNEDYDLELIIIEKPYILKDDSPHIIIDDETGEVIEVSVFYRLDYEIVNNYTYPFNAKVITRIVNPDNPTHWLYNWDDDVELDPGESTGLLSKTLKVICSENPSEDYEKYFVDKEVIVETGSGSGSDVDPTNNLSVERVVNFFDIDEDEATATQTFASVPSRDVTKTKTIGNVEVDYEIISELHEKDNVLSCFRSRGKTLEDYINTDEFQNIKDWADAQPLGVLEDLWAVI